MLTAEQNYRLLQEIEANRMFLLMVYQQNPELLERAEARIKQMFEMPAHGVDNSLSPVLRPDRTTSHSTRLANSASQVAGYLSSERGTSLIELIMFIVIVSVALAGILLVMNVTTKNSADPLIHKQAIAVAESLLEEIQLQDFIDPNGATVCPLPASAVMPTNRASDYHIVDCYKNFPNSGPATGIYSVAGAAITDLASYTARVTIDSTTSPLGAIAAGSAVRITVTVTDPQGTQIAIDGYRTRY